MKVLHASALRQDIAQSCVNMLKRWATYSFADWTWLSPDEAARQHWQRGMRSPSVSQYTPTEPVAGYYGTGYASWGVMAQAATVGVYAVLARSTADQGDLAARCLKGLRFLFSTHAAGPLRLTDGSKWGAGVSPHDDRYAPLWLEQGMLAYDLMEDLVPPYDRTLVRSVLVAEADRHLPSGAGRAEANAWKAALLARAAAMYPECRQAADWRQQARLCWMNAISVGRGAQDAHLVRSRPVREGHEGATLQRSLGAQRDLFHPIDIALSLGAMTLAGLMHMRRGQSPPAETFYHWPEALAVLTRLCLWDGTLACVCGQTWPRFTWEQYLMLPVLAWAAVQPAAALAPSASALSAADALIMAQSVLQHLAAEQECNGDGSFYSQRLASLRAASEWEYLRYEAGTAFMLAVTYCILSRSGSEQAAKQAGTSNGCEPTGSYRAPALGMVWHRSEARFASWCWQSCRLPAQGLVLPRSGRRLCEWNGNLVGTVRLKEHMRYHSLQYHREYEFTGGFATMGLLAEQMPAWPMADKTPSLRHGIGLVALPDGYTSILLDLVWCERQVNVVENRGLLFRLANDITNGNVRHIGWAGGSREVPGVGAQPETWHTQSPWLLIDDCLLIKGLSPGRLTLQIRGSRSDTPEFADDSLLVQDICLPLATDVGRMRAGEVLRDTCAAYVCEVTGSEAAGVAAALSASPLPVQAAGDGLPHARAYTVSDRFGREYILAVNFDRTAVSVPMATGMRPLAGHYTAQGGRMVLPPATLILCARA